MYLDPGGLGIAFQALIGLVLAIPVLIGIYWVRIKSILHKSKKN